MKNSSKYIILILTTVVTLFSCRKEDKVKSAVLDYIKEYAYNPASIEILSMEVVHDTLPIYLERSLATEIKSLPQLYEKAEEEANANKNPFSVLFGFSYKKDAQNKFRKSLEIISYELSSRKNECYNIVLVEFSSNNLMGSLSNLDVILILNENNDKVLASYVAEDYKNIVPIIYREIYKKSLPRNKFGNVEIEKVPKIDGYIMSRRN